MSLATRSIVCGSRAASARAPATLQSCTSSWRSGTLCSNPNQRTLLATQNKTLLTEVEIERREFVPTSSRLMILALLHLQRHSPYSLPQDLLHSKLPDVCLYQ